MPTKIDHGTCVWLSRRFLVCSLELCKNIGIELTPTDDIVADALRISPALSSATPQLHPDLPQWKRSTIHPCTARFILPLKARFIQSRTTWPLKARPLKARFMDIQLGMAGSRRLNVNRRPKVRLVCLTSPGLVASAIPHSFSNSC